MKRRLAGMIFFLGLIEFAFVPALPADFSLRSFGWGGGSSQPEAFFSTPDGGYVLAGTNTSFSRTGFIWKLTMEGDLAWTQTLGGVEDMSPTSDGGFLVAANRLVKLDVNGEKIWSLVQPKSEFVAVRPALDGGVIAIGRLFSWGNADPDTFVMKLSPERRLEWARRAGGGDIILTGVQVLPQGYALLARSPDTGSGVRDACLIVLNEAGVPLWQKLYGGDAFDVVNSLAPLPDGGFIAAGATRSYGAGATDLWILRLQEDGSIEWQRTFGGLQTDDARDIRPTGDGGFIVAGSIRSWDDMDGVLVKLSAAGTLEWCKKLAHADNISNPGETLDLALQTSDGGYLAVGTSAAIGIVGDNWRWPPTNILLLRFNARGDLPACHAVRDAQLATSQPTAPARPVFFPLMDFTPALESQPDSGSYLAPPEIKDICPEGKNSVVRR